MLRLLGPWPQMLHWFHGSGCQTELFPAVWNKGHSFVIDYVDASCLVGIKSLSKVVWKGC